MATPEQIRRRGRWSLVFGAVLAALAIAATAYADNLQSDLDTTTGGLDKIVNLGVLPPGTAWSQDIFLFVQTQPGATNDPTYPFDVAGVKDATSTFPGSVAFSGVTITGPNTANGQTGQITWMTPAAHASAQNYTIVETFEANTTINEASATVTINFSIAAAPADSTPPVIAPTVTGTLGNDGWYVSDVTVSWTVADNESAISSSSGCGTTTITTDTAGTTLSCTATSAGGTASQSVTVKRDATAPSVVLEPADDACSVPGNNGWCRGEQTAGFTASDATSGLATDGASSRGFTQSTTTNGSSVSIPSGSVSDVAGNTNPGIDAGPYKIDSIAPSVTCESPAPVFLLNQPAAQVSAAVADSTSLPVNTTEFASADTSTAGSASVAITGQDMAGNSTTAACAYRVGYAFDGLYAPIDRPNTLNVSKAGQTIPLKWRLTDYNGDPVLTLTSVTVTVSSISCDYGTGTPDALEEYAAGASGLQNLGDGYYQFNWKTPTSYAGSCKSLNLNLGEGAARTGLALLSFKK